MAFSGLDSSSTESKPVTCCNQGAVRVRPCLAYLQESVEVWVGGRIVGHLKEWLKSKVYTSLS